MNPESLEDFFKRKNREIRELTERRSYYRYLKMAVDGLLTKAQIEELQSLPFKESCIREQQMLFPKCQRLFKPTPIQELNYN